MTDSPMAEGSPNRASRRLLARRGGALGAGGVLVAGSAAALLTALAGSAGAAATITVDSNADGAADATHCTDGVFNNCTLRDAAAAAVAGDTITFFPSVTNITLTQGGRIDLGAVNVAGPGSASLAITTTAAAGLYEIFNFQGTGDVTVSGLSLTVNGIWTGNTGNFTMDDVSISNSYNGYGGALYAQNSGDLVISGSHFENNESGNGNKGGAIYAINAGDVTITDTEIIDNGSAAGSGGGIFVSSNAASFSLTDSVVTGNSSQFGGGLDVRAIGVVTIENSDITSNSAVQEGGGAITSGNAAAEVRISGSTFDGNTAGQLGGGLNIRNRPLVVSNSTISNNDSQLAGGGIFASDSHNLTINNSTIAGNQGIGGGGFYAHSVAVAINQSTITDNFGTGGAGGVFLYEGSLHVSGSIISGNSSVYAGREDVRTLYTSSVSSDHSIMGTVSGTPMTDDGGTVYSTSPGLLALADNGGLTRTMALDPTSIAIDAGPDPVPTFTGNEFDQRGDGFDRVSNGTADIGAFEMQVGPPPTSSTTTVPTSSSSTTAPPASTTTLAIDPNATVGVDPVVPEFTG